MNRIKRIVWLLPIVLLPVSLTAQLEINGALDLMLSQGGEDSHFYYNTIHKDQADWRAGIYMLSANLAYQKNRVGLAFGFFLERDNDTDFGQFIVRELQLSLRLGKEQRSRLTIGRFVTPYGSHVEKQYQSERYFIDRPLFYNYYVNISDRIGWAKGLGNRFPVMIGGSAEWGITNMYYHGYSTGILFEASARKEQDRLAVALTSTAPPSDAFFADSRQISLIGKYIMHVDARWQQSLFFSYGNFMEDNPLSDEVAPLGNYTQILTGMSTRFASGFFESLLEFNTAWYTAAAFDTPNNQYFRDDDGNILTSNLTLLSISLDLAYEMPFLSGAFIAYRLGWMKGLEPKGFSEPWESRVLRNSFAAGYKINNWSTAKLVITIQDIEEHNWDLNTFKILLSFYY